MKRAFSIAIVVVCIFAAQSLIFSIVSLWQKQDVVRQAQQQLAIEQKKNTQLKKQLAKVQSPQFLEEEARDKLFLQKEGENQVIVPDNQNISLATQKQVDTRPNLQKWFDLFFKD